MPDQAGRQATPDDCAATDIDNCAVHGWGARQEAAGRQTTCGHTWTGAHGESRECQREQHDGGSHSDLRPCPTCQPLTPPARETTAAARERT